MHYLLHHASRIAEIQEIIITKRYQAQGIGGELFAKAKEAAKELGYPVLLTIARDGKSLKNMLNVFTSISMTI